MMQEKWYQLLLKKISQSYNTRLIVNDTDNLGQAQDIRSILEDKFALHDYNGELTLRRFLLANTDRRILIFKTSNVSYIPYDVEANSDVIHWQLKDIFPKLNASVLKKVPAVQYQTIFEGYKDIECSLSMVGEEETCKLVAKWLASQVKSSKPYGNEDRPIFGIPGADGRSDSAYCCALLVKRIKEMLMAADVDWKALGPAWGELSYWHCLVEADLPEIDSLDQIICQRFEKYIKSSYHKLFYDSFTTGPTTIDKALHYLAYLPPSKKVLLCMDGMGFQEWFCLKQYFAERGVRSFNEMAVFALVPTLTGISRRALFCGRSAAKDRIEENKGFLQFVRTNWPGGRTRPAGMFMHVDGRWRGEYAGYEYIGLINNLVDDVAHSMIYVQDHKRLMQKNLMEHLQHSGLADMVERFLDKDYRVFITADHGTVWCRGNGHKVTKWLVEERAKRVLMYPNKLLAEEFARDKEDVYIYDNNNLFGDSVAVFPAGRGMFGNKNDTAISHGGIHPEEVIIPFVEVLA